MPLEDNNQFKVRHYRIPRDYIGRLDDLARAKGMPNGFEASFVRLAIENLLFIEEFLLHDDNDKVDNTLRTAIYRVRRSVTNDRANRAAKKRSSVANRGERKESIEKVKLAGDRGVEKSGGKGHNG